MANSACHCTLFLFLLIARICDATDYNDFEMERKHELWMAEHGRVYKDEAEKARRFQIFKKNVKYIEDFNKAGGHKYTLGVNLFTDLTTEEFLSTYASGFKTPESEIGESLRSLRYEMMEPVNTSDIPSSHDWRDAGAVTSVKFQGKCDACWAFVTVATVESLIKIKKGVLYDLSPQQLVDCDKHNKGCKGGHMYGAYRYIESNGGITTEANYPYTSSGGVEGTCDATKESKPVATIGGFDDVRPNSEPSLMAAVAQQPVGTAVDASPDFQHYKSGVFNGSCGFTLNHAVTIVGYGETSSSTKYWIAKNSWGSKWGEAGYIRIEKDVAWTPKGLCGLVMSAWYPTL